MENDRIRQIIAETLHETTRRQKAMSVLNGTNNKVQTMAILTSENPRYSGEDDENNLTNAIRRKNLEKDLKIGHYAWFPVKGQYGGKENSYIIYNISLDDALHLGRKFGQEAVIFCDKGHCQYWEQGGDGKFEKTHERDMTQRVDMTDASDYYTQVSRNFKFQLPFFDGSDENQQIMNESIQYVNEVINERVSDENEANRRIETTLKAPSGYNRYCNRGQLYGNAFQW